MKHIFIRLVCVACLFSSCNSEEELANTNPEHLEDGEALVCVTLKSSTAPATYAGDGAYGTHTAFPEENVVKSIAFFVKKVTTDVTDAPLMHYMSTEDDGSDQGLIEGLVVKDASAGLYEARFKMKGVVDADDTPVEFFVIANYRENGIDLSGIQKESDLEDITKAATVAKSDNSSNPLVMSAVNTESIGNGVPFNIEVKLKRLVSRIDIVNKASEAGFELKSARILSGKTQSYFLPDMAEAKVNDIAVADFATAQTPHASDLTRIDSLYTYENTNHVSTSATRVEVTGIYNGDPFSEKVSFTKQDAMGEDTIVSILRNNLYTIYIHPSADSTEVKFEVVADDWGGKDTLGIQASRKKPELSDFDDAALAAAGITWTPATKTIDITDATAPADFLFTASGNQRNQITVKYRGTAETAGGATGVAWMEGNVKSEQQDASSLLSQRHTLTLPHLTGSTPGDALILVQNATNIEASDTIRIKYRPNYPGTTLKSVLVGGVFWAPVNVGATTIPATLTVWSKATCGQLYQWGRNQGFDYGVAGEPVAGPVAYGTVHDENGLSGGDNMGKYITTSVAPHDWLDTDPTNLAIRNSLWTAAVNINPCPAGWKVPTEEELKKLVRAAGIHRNTNGVLTIPSNTEPGTNLILPAAGSRSHEGIFDAPGANCNYWSSSLSLSGQASYLYIIGTKAPSITRAVLSNGFSLRCVQK